MTDTGVLVVGAGGHAKVVIATLRAAGIAVRAVLDDRPESWGQQVLGYEVLGDTEILGAPFMRAVIAIGNNAVRQALSERFSDVEWVSAVHPAATVCDGVTLGAGSVVFAGAVVQPDTQIGAHVIVNTGATVDHDCVLADAVHVAPGSHLAGSVRLDQGVFVGLGAALLPGVHVGAWSTIGAGSVVVRDLPAGVTVVGAPARTISRAQQGGK